MNAIRGITAAGLLVAAMTSCGGRGDRAPSSPDPCARIGDRCRTPDGPVGVCNDTGRTDCPDPPCLACIPQH